MSTHFLTLFFVAAVSSLIIFLVYIYPNMRKPVWERKIISANYLRLRDRAAIADDVLIDAIRKEPFTWQLYINLFLYYATPWDMQKLYKIMEFGAEQTNNPGIVARAAWCLIEEGEWEKAEAMLKREDIEDYLFDHNLPFLPRLYFKQENYQECEKSFVAFYKKIYNSFAASDKPISDENKIFADLSADELIMLVIARKKLNKEWIPTAKIIPVTSVQENNWTTYYEKLLEQKAELKVETGIYGPPEQLLSLREKELNERIEAVKEHLRDR
ncbi:MAG: hypothetical protein FWC36_06220 [Spirochaetes bacterium]|nr:hypothetical protein [Spirochaetota bacterium]